MFGLNTNKQEKVIQELKNELENLKQEFRAIDIKIEEVDIEEIQYSEPLKIAVFGEYNSGKSSLINTILGKDVSETGIVPTTDKIIEFVYSKEQKRVEFGEKIQVGINEERLKVFHLVDLPGINSIIESHRETVIKYISKADIVLFCTSSQQPLKNSELWLIKEFIKDSRELIVLITMSDTLSANELNEVINYVENELHRIFSKRVRVLSVSAKAYRERGRDDGIQKLLDYIEEKTKELGGKQLIKYRQNREANLLYGDIKEYKRLLEKELDKSEENEEKCKSIKNQIEKREKEIENTIEDGKLRLVKFLEELSFPNIIIYFMHSLITKFLTEKHKESIFEDFRREYEIVQKEITYKLNELLNSAKKYVLDILKDTHIEPLDDRDFVLKESNDAYKLIRNLVLVNYTLLSVLLILLSLLFVNPLLNAPIRLLLTNYSNISIDSILWFLALITILVIAIFFLKGGGIAKWYLKKYINYRKTSILNFGKLNEIKNKINRFCKANTERKETIKKHIEKLEYLERKLKEVTKI